MTARIVHIKSRDEWLHPEAYTASLYAGDHDRIQQLVRLNRKEMWQDRVKWFCVAVAGFSGCYFIAEFLR